MRAMSDEDPQWPEGVCEVCGKPAETQITDIDRAGHVSVRNICLDHTLPPEVLERMPEKYRAMRQRWIDMARARRDRAD